MDDQVADAERNTGRHQPDEVIPDGQPCGGPDLLSGAEGVNAVPEQHLAPVHVADPRQHGLVHQ
jgi:hypothetical protein